MERKLPPLNAVKAFEASARLGGFSQAARELRVTAGAVSQQVKILEDFFAKQLFIRRNNQLQLTDAGLAVYADSAAVMGKLSDMARRLTEGATRSRFVISTLPSVAVRWLNHRVIDFLQAEPEIRCEIRVEEDPVDFSRQPIDLRLCYGQHLYPEMTTIPIIRDEVTPLCAPAFLAQRGIKPADPATLADKDLIHTDWGATFASYPTWSAWFGAAGIERRPKVELGHTLGMSSLAIDFAVAGLGIALGQRLLAREELADGRLVAPFETAIPLGYDYCAVYPQAKGGKRLVGTFIDRLIQSLQQTSSDTA
jgi:LysR family glycine cleavage system transcriptional activator